MLRAELAHHVCQLVVHVGLDTAGSFLLLGGLFANDLGADRPLRRESLGDRLTLKSYNGLGNHGVEHARRAVPRLRALLDLQAQQLQTLGVGFLPLLA